MRIIGFRGVCMDRSNEFSTEHLVTPPGVILPSTGPEYTPDRLLERKRRLAEQYAAMQAESIRLPDDEVGESKS